MKFAYPFLAGSLATGTALAGPAYHYGCLSKDGLFGVREITVSLAATGMRLGFHTDGSVDFSDGKLDPAYRPRAWTNSVQFTGFSIPESGSVSAIVAKEMLIGAPIGKVQLRWRGEAYSSGLYLCRKK